eukprot:6939254-Prymnesium_polylepis.1
MAAGQMACPRSRCGRRRGCRSRGLVPKHSASHCVPKKRDHRSVRKGREGGPPRHKFGGSNRRAHDCCCMNDGKTCSLRYCQYRGGRNCVDRPCGAHGSSDAAFTQWMTPEDLRRRRKSRVYGDDDTLVVVINESCRRRPTLDKAARIDYPALKKLAGGCAAQGFKQQSRNSAATMNPCSVCTSAAVGACLLLEAAPQHRHDLSLKLVAAKPFVA